MSKPITDFFAASPKKRKAEPAEAESGSQEKTEAKESKSTLTAEQQARAEENKKKAMEKLAAKRQKVMEVAAAAAAADDDEKKADSADGYGILPSILEGSWREHLAAEFDKASFKGLVKFLNKEEAAGKKIFPPKDQVFNAFNNCPFENVKVVIIGQDPYHNPGEAMGMCFSVPRGVKVPSSLRNIYKELSTDITKGPHKFSMPKHGDLTKWAQQGVLLLNAVLTVQAKTPTSHQKQGWENFTDAAISAINKDLKGVVFLLWGRHAQEKAKLIDGKKHHILKTVHPSGLSASKGFFGCKHFSKANDLLKTSGKEPIDWNVD